MPSQPAARRGYTILGLTQRLFVQVGGRQLRAAAAAAELPALVVCRLLLTLGIAAAVVAQPAMFRVQVGPSAPTEEASSMSCLGPSACSSRDQGGAHQQLVHTQSPWEEPSEVASARACSPSAMSLPG